MLTKNREETIKLTRRYTQKKVISRGDFRDAVPRLCEIFVPYGAHKEFLRKVRRRSHLDHSGAAAASCLDAINTAASSLHAINTAASSLHAMNMAQPGCRQSPRPSASLARACFTPAR